MTTIRQFCCDDLFKFNNINLDPWTETYGIGFYLQYLARWPEYFLIAESPGGDHMGYIMGKAEGNGDNYHGHVTAVSCGTSYRRLGLAKRMMDALEEVSENKKCFFVDLFVRASNSVAINMYNKLGYVVYRTVLDYYSGGGGGGDDGPTADEDAYDMRKALSRDVERKSIIPLNKPVHFNELEC